ncbi:MAG: 4a-hydroxytetrahydrobiopterin dehydratase [Zetaproteobacteria bacterium]|nr:MAG: 4a-hydroxytetrahydrobiopterin dehydratase [Zetaproteobacteria bacterium]
MSKLSIQKCEACHSEASHISDEDLEKNLLQLPDWTQKSRDGILTLERTYKFKNYLEAVSFTNKVANLAEEEGHHPEILLEWGKVKVIWWTHAINGLHQNDFICAAKSDALNKE